MDSVTHAVSGVALIMALPRRPATAWAVPLSMTVSSLPDIDVFFHSIPIDSLLLHRGITHALPVLPIYVILCSLLMYPLWRRNTPGAWTFMQTVLFTSLLLLVHIWLDCVTTYGTLAFIPFSDYRVRLNGMYIIDFLLLIPLILACCFAKHRPRIAALAVIWLLLYSGGAVAWRMHLENKWNATLLAEGIIPAKLNVLPDAFSPLYWKVQYEHDGVCFQTSLAWNGLQASPWQQGRSADPDLLARLASEDRTARIWKFFTLFPLQEEHDWEGGREYSFYDWRFGTLVPFIRIRQRDGTDYFRLMARIDENDNLVAVRYISFPGERNLGWQPPVAPKGRGGIRWFIGLDN